MRNNPRFPRQANSMRASGSMTPIGSIAWLRLRECRTHWPPQSHLPRLQKRDSSHPTSLFMCNMGAEDQDIASKAQGALTRLGYRGPGIEKVNKVPSRLQVRYYRPDQKSHAGELAGELGKALGLPAGPDNAIFVTSSQ